MKVALIPATLLAGALMLATPAATWAQHRGGGGRGGGSPDARALLAPRGGERSYSRGSQGREGGFQGNRSFPGGEGDRGRHHDRDHDRDRYRGGFRGGYYGYYSAPYYSYGYSYPTYPYSGSYCNPNGYYDAYGNWYPDPNCSYDPYSYYGY